MLFFFLKINFLGLVFTALGEKIADEIQHFWRTCTIIVFFLLRGFQFGPMKFWETMDLEVTFDIDLHKIRADGKVHDLTTHVKVNYNGSGGACTSFSGFREFTTEGPSTVSVKYYVPRKFEPSE